MCRKRAMLKKYFMIVTASFFFTSLMLAGEKSFETGLTKSPNGDTETLKTNDEYNQLKMLERHR